MKTLTLTGILAALLFAAFITTPSPRFDSSQFHHFSGEVDTAWVRHYASGLVPAFDIATAIAIARASEIYMTGENEMIKYRSDGVEECRMKSLLI